MSQATTPVERPTAAARGPMRELFDAYGDAWASHDAEAITAFHAEDGVFHLHADGEPVRGRDAIRATFAAYLAQWPDLAFDEQDSHLHEWGWVVRWTMSGTLAEAGEVADGASAEAGARFAVDAVDVIEVEQGKLKAKHTYIDTQALLRQLGG